MLSQYPNLKKYNLSSLHLALVAAAPLKQEQAEDLMRALNIKVRQGMSDLCFVWNSKFGSFRKILQGFEDAIIAHS